MGGTDLPQDLRLADDLTIERRSNREDVAQRGGVVMGVTLIGDFVAADVTGRAEIVPDHRRHPFRLGMDALDFDPVAGR